MREKTRTPGARDRWNRTCKGPKAKKPEWLELRGERSNNKR